MQAARNAISCAGGVRLGIQTGIICVGGFEDGRRANVYFLPVIPSLQPWRILTPLSFGQTYLMPLVASPGDLLMCERLNSKMMLVEKGANKSVFFVNQHTVGGTRDGTPTHMTRVMSLNTEAEEFETIPGLTVGPALIDFQFCFTVLGNLIFLAYLAPFYRWTSTWS